MKYDKAWPLATSKELAEEILGESLEMLVAQPENDLEMLELLANKLWRLNNLYTIVDKHGNKKLLAMNYAQLHLYKAHLLHPRVIVLKSRQQGISTYELIDSFDDAMFKEDFTAGLMSQGKRESGILLQRSKLLWKELPSEVKTFMGLDNVRDNTEAIKLSNGSTLLIGVSFRSQTLQRLHISELGKIAAENPKRVEETFTGSLQALAAGNYATIESTAEGDNEFKTIWDRSVVLLEGGLEHFGPKDFYPLFLSWADDPDCRLAKEQADTKESLQYFEAQALEGFVPSNEQKWWWISQYRELGTKIYQEYPRTPEEAFRASIDSAFWSAVWRDCGVVFVAGQAGTKILPDGSTLEWYAGEYDYDVRLPVYCVQDLGINDYNTLVVYQRYKGRYRIVAEYWNNNQAVRHYMGWLKRWCVGVGAGWREMKVYLPHDSTKRMQTDLTTVVDMYSDEGWDVSVLERPTNKMSAIDAVRWEVEQQHIVVSSECGYAIKTMANYRRDWDPKLEVWKNQPRHDEWSHMADSITYMVMSDVPDEGVESYSYRSVGV